MEKLNPSKLSVIVVNDVVLNAVPGGVRLRKSNWNSNKYSIILSQDELNALVRRLILWDVLSPRELREPVKSTKEIPLRTLAVQATTEALEGECHELS